MHERTRCNLCRLAFLAIGVVPTLCTLAWAGYRTSPLYAEAERRMWETRLSAATGFSTQIGRLEFPDGRSLLLHDLTFVDPDGDERLARVRQVEIAYLQEGLVILLSQPEVDPGKFLRMWDAFHERVLRDAAPNTRIQITSGELTLEVGPHGQTFTMVRCTMEPVGNSIRTTIDFQLAGVETPTPAQLIIERNRQITPAVTRWSLHTNTPLPCSIFTSYLPPLEALGNKALFEGSVVCTLGREDTSAELRGRFLQVDLSALTDSLQHRLGGFATVQLDPAIIVDGMLSSARGAILSQGGTVSRSLVADLAKYVPLASPEVVLASHGPLILYDRLAFQFHIAADGFSIAGLEPSDGNVILTTAGQPLLTGDQQPYSLVSLVRALAPDSQYLVPATGATKSLLKWLAFPSPRPRTSPQPRVHLSDRPERVEK